MKKEMPYYDINYDYDTSHLPKYLQEIIKDLETFWEKRDGILYDINFEILEAEAKSFLINHKITETDFKKLMRKYGWYDV